MGKLIPPDPKQCQAEKPNGVTFMTLGGRHQLVRCEEAPRVVATERNPRGGKRGSMSLCGDCLEVMRRQCPGFATFEPLTLWLDKQSSDVTQKDKK